MSLTRHEAVPVSLDLSPQHMQRPPCSRPHPKGEQMHFHSDAEQTVL